MLRFEGDAAMKFKVCTFDCHIGNNHVHGVAVRHMACCGNGRRLGQKQARTRSGIEDPSRATANGRRSGRQGRGVHRIIAVGNCVDAGFAFNEARLGP